MSFIIRHTPHGVKKTYWAHRLISFVRERQYRRRYYNSDACVAGNDRQVIFRIDGRFNHGGLCDRLWGCLAVYNYCKRNGLRFRIDWRVPFKLETFFEPAQYDWCIDRREVSFNPKESRLLIISNNHNEKNQWRLLDRIGHVSQQQVHVYTPAHVDRDDFGLYFKELFRPSPLLKKAIDEEKRKIGGDYVSVSFRFMQLLGDFKDMYGETLSPEEQRQLLQRSLATIKKVHEANPDVAKVLVTSDSIKLIEAASVFPWVHIITGAPVHIGFTDEVSDIKHLKTFVDFMMIADAQKVYFAQAPGIYGSTFAHTASKINKRPFEKIEM